MVRVKKTPRFGARLRATVEGIHSRWRWAVVVCWGVFFGEGEEAEGGGGEEQWNKWNGMDLGVWGFLQGKKWATLAFYTQYVMGFGVGDRGREGEGEEVGGVGNRGSGVDMEWIWIGIGKGKERGFLGNRKPLP